MALNSVAGWQKLSVNIANAMSVPSKRAVTVWLTTNRTNKVMERRTERHLVVRQASVKALAELDDTVYRPW